MQASFNNRSFAFLEVWKVDISTTWTINIETIATVKWSWTMVFGKHIWAAIKHFVPGNNDWLWLPFWWNRYHEIGETGKKEVEKTKELQKTENTEIKNEENKENKEDYIINNWDLEKTDNNVQEIDNNNIQETDNIIQETGEETINQESKETKNKDNTNLLANKESEKTEILPKSPKKIIREFAQAFANWFVRTYRIEKYKDWTINVLVKNTKWEFEISTELNWGIPKWKYSKENYDARIKNELVKIKESEEGKKFFEAEPTKTQVREFTQAFENWFVKTYRIEKSANWEVKILVKNSDWDFEKATEENLGIPKGQLGKNFNERVKIELDKIKNNIL
jgi:hypothetical protein